MTQQPNSLIRLKVLGSVIALIQLFDIVIHARTDQLEPLRVTSNIIILLWLFFWVLRKLDIKSFVTSIGVVGSYLVLNIIFLAREGITNPQQGGQLRIMLILLVFLTITLSTLLSYPKKTLLNLGN